MTLWSHRINLKKRSVIKIAPNLAAKKILTWTLNYLNQTTKNLNGTPVEQSPVKSRPNKPKETTKVNKANSMQTNRFMTSEPIKVMFNILRHKKTIKWNYCKFPWSQSTNRYQSSKSRSTRNCNPRLRSQIQFSRGESSRLFHSWTSETFPTSTKRALRACQTSLVSSWRTAKKLHISSWAERIEKSSTSSSDVLRLN